jgi:alpha-D-xyloside xylohydrolase
MRALVWLLVATLLGWSARGDAQDHYRRTETGVVVTPASGTEKAVRLEVYGPRIIRVTAVPDDLKGVPPSLMVIAPPVPGGFEITEAPGSVVLSTGAVAARVDLTNGNVSFRDGGGQVVLAESGPAIFTPATAEGRPFLAVRQQFNRGTDEGFYGLGQHQNGQMDYLGEDVELAQHNMDVAVPFVVSTRKYGLLWDNNSITRFGDPRPYALAGETLRVTGDGGQPGFTALYYVGGKLALQRQERVIDYQYIDDQRRWPEEAKPGSASGDAAKQRVVWTGTLHPDVTGTHKFRLYSSSYVKLFVDGKLVLERWRQNWNPWYHNFELQMVAGKPAQVRIEWEPNGGYIALLHNDPLPAADRNSLTLSSELGRALDYYFVGGNSLDEVIAGYRALTGKAVMLPKWAYGFWQSRQRYNNQDEVLGVVREYRRRGLPLDNIVQDWFYWKEDQWGSHEFDPARYPEPKRMIEEIHALDGRFMISVWPKFYHGTANYKELARVGAVYTRNLEAGEKDWVGPGYLNTDYDPYDPKGRAIYWRQIKERLAVLGVDAWWMDATEPDIHSNLSIEERAYRMGPTKLGPGAAYFNSFPLVHAEGVYQGWRAFKPDVRSFILTRSAFGGLQRTGSAVWSGDVASRWDDLRDQISAGVNFSMSGIPNWTHDIGGFANEERYTKQDPAHVAEWRELNTRWFQFGAFSPLFRSHGEFPKREIYEMAPEDSPTYRSMEYYDRLRYRLLPYIYTLAGDTWHRDGTMMRGLVMDFPDDPAARKVADQYMFGPALLVAPVTRFKQRSRSVYLPSGSWYDASSGRHYHGGRRIHAAAPYERMPLFVRAGSIVPTGPDIQHTEGSENGPITLIVYTGADGRGSLYEDDGVSLQYQRGAFSRILMTWDERRGILTLGRREGNFPGMVGERRFRIRWVTPRRSFPLDTNAASDATIDYRGEPATLSRPR